MLKRRIRNIETHGSHSAQYVPNTVVTVSEVIFEKDKDGHVSTHVPEDAVYKDAAGTVVTKDQCGVWCYADGSAMPVSGLVLIVREGHQP